MPDSIQRTSSVPIPERITERAFRDPLPVDSNKQIDKANDDRLKPTEDRRKDDFETYLNDTSILHLEQNQDGNRFDPAKELSKNGVYFDPGKSSPV